MILFSNSFDIFLYILLQDIASFRNANGLFIKGQYRPLIMAIMNIILSILLIFKFGIFGTVLATVICRLLTQWYDPFLLFKYVFKRPFFEFYKKYISYVIMYFISCFTTYFISRCLTISNLFFDLLIKALLCILIPNLITIVFTSRTNEFKYCIDMIKKKLLKKGN